MLCRIHAGRTLGLSGIRPVQTQIRFTPVSYTHLMCIRDSRSAVNAIASFVSSASVGVLITSKLYQRGIYTKKEAALIATGFSAVSVGFAYKVIETADLSEYFLPIYFIALLVTLIVSFFMARIPPLSRKASVFADGRQQTKEEIQAERVPARAVLKTGASRAVKKAATAPGLFKEIRSSILDSCYVLPKVISLLTAVDAPVLSTALAGTRSA